MYQIYEIINNDTIASIAQKFNTTIEELRKINGMGMNYLLNPGNYIVVPNMESELYQVYIVETGDNLYQIAKKTGTTTSSLVLINGLKEDEFIYPGQQLLIPKKGVGIYITDEDTIEDVSNKLGISVADLMEQNKTIYLLPEQIIIYKKRENL